MRELILHAGYAAALWLGRWEEALALNAEVIEITVARGATDLEIAHTRFNGYGPLLRLGRVDEAERLLLACRAVFQDEGDLASLGKVLGALADIEDKRGHPDDAIGFAQAALRYAYAARDPDVVATSHHNLATSLERTGKDPAAALAHQLAAGIIGYQMGSGRLTGWLHALTRHLARSGEAASLPASFSELCAVVEQVEGVRLANWSLACPRRAADGDQALAEVLRLAQALPDQAPGDAKDIPGAVGTLIADVIAAARGDQPATAADRLKRPPEAQHSDRRVLVPYPPTPTALLISNDTDCSPSPPFLRQPPLPRHQPPGQASKLVSGLNVAQQALLQSSATVLSMGHLLGYARVSTTDQQPQLQVDALERAGCYRVFVETASGARADRPVLAEVLDQLRPGDTLVVWKLDRLGRSLRHLVDTVTQLAERGIGFRSLQEAIDTTTPGGQLVFHVFAALAEVERDLIRERTVAGLAAARARGRRGGRPSVITAHKARVAGEMYRSGQYTVAAIATTLGVSRASIYRHLRQGG